MNVSHKTFFFQQKISTNCEYKVELWYLWLYMAFKCYPSTKYWKRTIYLCKMFCSYCQWNPFVVVFYSLNDIYLLYVKQAVLLVLSVFSLFLLLTKTLTRFFIFVKNHHSIGFALRDSPSRGAMRVLTHLQWKKIIKKINHRNLTWMHRNLTWNAHLRKFSHAQRFSQFVLHDRLVVVI